MRIDVREILKLPIPTLLLGALNVFILGAALVLALGGTQAADLLATPAKSAPALAIDLGQASAPADLAAIQAQPLMHATRAFYTPPPVTAPVAPPLPEYRLAGSFIAPNKPPVALLAGPQTTRRVHAGDDLDGWRVESIAAKRVVLRWQEQTKEIGTVAAVPTVSGLKRVTVQRQRVVSTGGNVISLGAAGTPAPEAAGRGRYAIGSVSDAPRLYRPPPN